MNQDGRQIVLNNLIGLGLSVIAIVAFTAGTYLEILLIGFIISIPFMTLQLIRQPNWIWRIVFIGILGLQIHSFNEPRFTEIFEAKLVGYFLSDQQIAKLEWLSPISAGFCLTSFWIVLISTMKKSKKTLSNNG